MSLRPGIPLSWLVFSSIPHLQLCNIFIQAEKHHHPYIGYDPTGHHATSRTAEQNHARRGPAVPPTRHTEPERPADLPLIRRAPRPVPVMFPPTVKHAQTVQNVYKPLQHPGSNPIRRPAPIPRPAIFASSLHPHVQIAKSPIQRPPSPAGHPGGYVHDIQKSSRWGPQHHTGVKGPGVRPY